MSESQLPVRMRSLQTRALQTRSGRVLLLVVLGLAMCAALAVFWPSSSGKLRFSTGSEVGIYHRVAQRISESLRQSNPGVEIELQTSLGSQENISRLESGDANLAIVQNDSIGGSNIRSLAALYPEVLHLVCRKESKIRCLDDLADKRVSLGARDSGTAQLTNELLRFARIQIEPGNVQFLSFEQSADGLRDQEIDAAFFLVGIGAEAIDRLLQTGSVELVSIQIHSVGDSSQFVEPAKLIDGFQVHYPFASFIEIPMMSYSGLPSEPIASVGVQAVFVCRADLPDAEANWFVETLFAQRAVLGRELTLLSQLDENFAQASLQFPLHPGAESYFRRNEPGFLAENAETIGLIITVLLLIASALHSLHRWYAQSRKNHVDTYYRRVQDLLQRLDDVTESVELDALTAELKSIGAAACDELIDERLDADHSYVILQHMVEFCDTQIRRRYEALA
ncbi:hypothetical protein SAMN06265222_102393 [Neorhodopirellula lusitana]|uniref:TRAP transporter solute receptor, TAXI family n=1 Tax=Neorhodopirellula lusitana TaxID=445327 RepID=A0ABY1PWR1_9BACT|nr:TAXI family TRAP transporter solute-binding subunit [Neorhodopirellula lusitana]SMP48214.1 hypothetical protein SAMN06265222_102393 [Neorhodopirellula lusitana]